MGFEEGAVFGGEVEGFLHRLIATCLAGEKLWYTGWKKFPEAAVNLDELMDKASTMIRRFGDLRERYAICKYSHKLEWAYKCHHWAASPAQLQIRI